MTAKNDLNEWRATLVPLGSSIQQAIHSLEASSMQIVLAVAEGNRLVGTLTDGDIRRAFLNGLNFDSVIDHAIQRMPIAVPPDMDQNLVLQIMKINKIHQLPILDQDGSVVGLHVWDSLITPKAIENFMIIMAGGKGTRLRPHTENCPKPMLEISGKPMLQHIIERATAQGFRNFMVSLNYLGHMIQEYFGDGNKYGVCIEYIKEEAPLGTAGCLSLLPQSPELPFIVANGDVLTDIQYSELLNFHNHHDASASMAVRQHEIQNPFGVVQTRGVDIEGFEEKPIYRCHVNAGIYVLDPSALNFLEYNQYCDMPTLFERIKKNSGRTVVYPMHEIWLDVGRPEDLLRARNSHVPLNF